MNAPDVTIRRLTATAHIAHDGNAADPRARIGRLLAGVAEHRLSRALQTVTLPSGTLCLRRLDVPVRLDLAASDAAIEEAWAATLANALAAALQDPALTVRFGGERPALVDLVAGIVSGRGERAWAWRQLGLLRDCDADPAVAPREALLAALSRRPAHASGAVVLATRRVGLAGLHRILGRAGWAAIAKVVCEASGVPGGSWSQLAETASAGAAHDRRLVASTSATTGRLPAGATSAAPQQRLAARLVATSSFAAAVRRSRLRPEDATVEAWAVLVATEGDPWLLRRSRAPLVLRHVAAILARSAALAELSLPPADDCSHLHPSVDGLATDTRSGTADGETRVPISTAAAPAVRTTGEDGPAAATPGADGAGQREQDPVTAPARTPPGEIAGEDQTAHDTAYAGLLFLLGTASAAGVPEGLLEEPAFAARTLPWVLHQVAVRLGVPPADAAAATFAGLDPGTCLPWIGDQPANEPERAALDVVAGLWSQATAVALGLGEEGKTDAVDRVIRRSGAIDWAPGWTEVRMPLDEVDLDVRRAGLDLDPGWVPWLGTVVRYVYA
jgi:hypothetical protein